MLKKIRNILIVLLLIIITTGCSNKLNTIKTLEDLNNKNIGVTTGSEYDTIVNKNIDAYFIHSITSLSYKINIGDIYLNINDFKYYLNILFNIKFG